MKNEAQDILKVAQDKFPNFLDGRTCVLELKERGSRNWRQMEWMGFYTEEILRDLLINTIGGSVGPRYGNTTFDYKKKFVWDIKIHALNDQNGKLKKWAILNDEESIRNVIRDFGIIGFILAESSVRYDMGNSFKYWHDGLKGKTSDYVKERIARGAPSRLRKTSAKIEDWLLFSFNNERLLATGVRDGWLNYFQEGMRNADGSPRRPKIMIDIHHIPKEIVLIV